ncbi:MAG: HD domain-containing protein [Candidatus Humimicrobiaceae bacterium]
MRNITVKTEIEIFQTFFPYLSFSGNKNVEMTDHDAMHAQRVRRTTAFLGSSVGLNKVELTHAKIGALLHDLGMGKERGEHEKTGASVFRSTVKKENISLDEDNISIIESIIRTHRGGYNNSEINKFSGSNIRTGLMCSVVRIADAMDIDERRSSSYDEKQGALEVFSKKQVPYHISVKSIKGTRFVCYEEPHIEVFIDNPERAQYHIFKLEEDIRQTPFSWGVSTYNVRNESIKESPQRKNKKAFVSSYCDLHGMIMGSITCNNLSKKGIDFEFNYGIKSTSDPEVFWKDIIHNYTNMENYGLFFFTDMHIPRSNPEISLDACRKLIENGKTVYYSHHLEQDVGLIPHLINIGVYVSLGDVWSCFYGNNLTESDIFWARIAALCDRDTSWLKVFWSPQIRDVKNGLNVLFFKALKENDESLIKEMIEKIRNDDRSYFSNVKDKIEDLYPLSDINFKKEGYFLIIDKLPALRGRISYLVLDQLMLKQGAHQDGDNYIPDHPYAVTIFERPDKRCHILFQSCWGKRIIPIRYFFDPDELNKPIVANDHSVWFECNNIEDAKSSIKDIILNINKSVDNINSSIKELY